MISVAEHVTTKAFQTPPRRMSIIDVNGGSIQLREKGPSRLHYAGTWRVLRPGMTIVKIGCQVRSEFRRVPGCQFEYGFLQIPGEDRPILRQ